MRYLCATMLVATLALTGAMFSGGCGSEDRTTIGVSIPSGDHGWTAGVIWWAQKAMAEHPEINWVFKTADSGDAQEKDIRSMMAQHKLDGLVVLAHNSPTLTPVAKEARDNGIFIVNVDRGFTEPVADVFIAGDNRSFGHKSAEFIVEKLGGEGNIVILRGITSTNVDQDRYEAAMDVFNQHAGIEVLAAQEASWNPEKALEVMQTYLTKFGDRIDAVWATDDDMAEMAEKAIKEANLQDKMWIFGGAGKKTIVKRVMEKDPMYPADVTYPPAMIAAGIHAAVYKLGGIDKDQLAERMPEHLEFPIEELETNPEKIDLEVYLVTPENAERYYFPDSRF